MIATSTTKKSGAPRLLSNRHQPNRSAFCRRFTTCAPTTSASAVKCNREFSIKKAWRTKSPRKLTTSSTCSRKSLMSRRQTPNKSFKILKACRNTDHLPKILPNKLWLSWSHSSQKSTNTSPSWKTWTTKETSWKCCSKSIWFLTSNKRIRNLNQKLVVTLILCKRTQDQSSKWSRKLTSSEGSCTTWSVSNQTTSWHQSNPDCTTTTKNRNHFIFINLTPKPQPKSQFEMPISCPKSSLQFRLKTKSSSSEERRRRTISDQCFQMSVTLSMNRPTKFKKERSWTLLGRVTSLPTCTGSLSSKLKIIFTQLGPSTLMRLLKNARCTTFQRTSGLKSVTSSSPDTTTQ